MSGEKSVAKAISSLGDRGKALASALRGGTPLRYRLELDSRAAEAEATGHPVRRLPARIVAYPHWANDYERAAKSAGIELALETAVREANSWLETVLNTNGGTVHA